MNFVAEPVSGIRASWVSKVEGAKSRRAVVMGAQGLALTVPSDKATAARGPMVDFDWTRPKKIDRKAVEALKPCCPWASSRRKGSPKVARSRSRIVVPVYTVALEMGAYEGIIGVCRCRCASLRDFVWFWLQSLRTQHGIK